MKTRTAWVGSPLREPTTTEQTQRVVTYAMPNCTMKYNASINKNSSRKICNGMENADIILTQKVDLKYLPRAEYGSGTKSGTLVPDFKNILYEINSN